MNKVFSSGAVLLCFTLLCLCSTPVKVLAEVEDEDDLLCGLELIDYEYFEEDDGYENSYCFYLVPSECLVPELELTDCTSTEIAGGILRCSVSCDDYGLGD